MPQTQVQARRILWLALVVSAIALASLVPSFTRADPADGTRRGWVGLVLRNLSATQRASLGRAGARITGVQPGSPAQRAGFTRGDVIVSMNGSLPGGDAQGLAIAFRRFDPGQKVTLRIVRADGSETDVTVVVAAYDSIVAVEACIPLAMEFLLSQIEVARSRAGHHARQSLALYALARVPAKLRAPHSAEINNLANELVTPLVVLIQTPVPSYQPPEDHYLNYRAALILAAANRLDAKAHAEASALLANYLRLRQLGVPGGARGDYDVYNGSWNYREPDVPDSVRGDLSVSSYVVEALATIPPSAESPPLGLSEASRRALHQFTWRCQNWGPVAGKAWNDSFPPAGDGGFFFAPGESKAGYRRLPGKEGFHLLSYGSATADAVRTLLRLGDNAESPRLRAAIEWLLEQDDLRRNPGFPTSHRIGFHRGLHYYWLRSLADALTRAGRHPARTATGREVAWAHNIADYLCPRQRSDRSWVNSSGVMGEDDPLVATSFCLLALSDCWKALSEE